MHDLSSRAGALAAGLVTLSMAACILDVVDLRYRTSPPSPPRCDVGERYDPATRACVACLELPPAPGACLCDWDYRDQGLPYCDVPGAYYDCLTCTGSIASCNDLLPATTAGQLGVTGDCARVTACCAELALEHEGRAECCPCGTSLRCDPDPSDPAHARFIVRCDPVPDCTPACEGLERCNIEGGCICEAVPP